MEPVELCPFCMEENIYLDWNVDRQGFVAKCGHCEEEILLCDECHQIAIENGQSHMCDWEETETGGKCRRGETFEKGKTDEEKTDGKREKETPHAGG